MRAAFTAKELRRFCQDRSSFEPVLSHFGPNFALEEMIDVLVEYCRTRILFSELVSEIEKVNPNQYLRYQTHVTAVPATARHAPSTRVSRAA
jgi:hypothetical protein